MDSHGTLKVKLQYKDVFLYKEEVVTIPFSTDYDNEIARLDELKKVKKEKRDDGQNLEIVRLRASTKMERTRQETEQTREAVDAFYRGMEVDRACFVVNFHRNIFKISPFLLKILLLL